MGAPIGPVEWVVAQGLAPYEPAVAEMEARVAAIREGRAAERIWLVEHPPLYTAGTSAQDADLVDPGRFPVHRTGRGGQYTYHGPGQRVAYVMLDLKQRGGDIRAYVCDLERWLIHTLAAFNVTGERRDGRVGVWVKRPGGGGAEDKIAALGVRVRRGVTYHGVALNVEPELGHYAGIVPCGITQHGVTSLHALGQLVSMEEVDAQLRASFEAVFGRATVPVEP
ncbi:lipoyl(octanoyl) transferase LipB [Desertibaculum subflavum]|uniref:lipoyl(octanoyl) transferase LipB n=1 Tax=Desertibaculum subflavum TaxID=2268458 RepID=UPI000E66F661